MSEEHSTEPASEAALLRRHLEREQAARRQAEQISERGMLALYRQQQLTNLWRDVASDANAAGSGAGILGSAVRRLMAFLKGPLAATYVLESGRWCCLEILDESAPATDDSFRRATSVPGKPALDSRSTERIDLQQARVEDPLIRLASARQLRWLIAVPVCFGRGEAVALLEFYLARLDIPSEQLLQTGDHFGETIGKVFEREHLHSQLERSRQDLQVEVSDQSRELGRLASQFQFNEQRFESIIDHLGEIVFETNRDGEFRFLNEQWERLTGRPVSETLGRSLGDFLELPDRRRVHDLWIRMLRDDLPVRGATFPLPLENGSRRFIELDASPMTAPGCADTVVGTIRDVSQRHRYEEKLRAANRKLERSARLKDEFLAAMSHELRTPLNSVLGFSEVLAEQVQGRLNEVQLTSLSHITESGRHLLDLINDILDLSKIEAGKEQLRPEPVSLAGICETALRMVRQEATNKNIRLTLKDTAGVGSIQADVRRLKQILVNLLSNAVKFTPAEGEVDLHVERDSEADCLLFRVRDTGIGIAEDDLPKLFQPFTQLDSRLSRQYGGTGLGLSLVQHMAEMHGGSVDVQSRLGEGSTFTVHLPLVEPPPNAEREERFDLKVPEVAGRAPTGPRLLLVEDDARNRELVVAYLKSKRYRVDTAENGLLGVQAARRLRPELILMDVQMPEMDGFEATSRIKSNPDTRHIPVIALTALAMTGDRERCLAAGADDHLSKPVNLRELASRIGMALAIRS